eukprot:TRINITY_DN15804_c0_g1_i1.p1 TRINITY_DN15804_c0_g1~~TRINITY_DN15804_c0_g1_i1.p1  ORF type:complete len:487 (-),score=69.74 TRINITY_DN15804_c0_g1_i1:233-1693(-)
MASWEDLPPEAYYFFASFGLSISFLITYASMLLRIVVTIFSCYKSRLAAVKLLEKLVQKLRRKKETDTACLNAIYTTATCFTYFMLLADVPAETAERTSAIFGGPIRVVFVQIQMGLATWVLSILVEGWTARMERSNLRLRAALTREATTRSLQAVVCDAVVNVTESLVLTEPSTQLAHFLVRPPPNGSYEGTSLLAFVQEEDRARVGQQITSSLVGPGTTLSIPTKLMDGNTAPVSVQMYCVPFVDSEDRRGYCIGILESKATSGSACRVDNCLVQATDSLPHAVLDVEVLRSVSEVGQDLEADGSAGSVVSGVVPLMLDAGVLEASVDLGNCKLPLLSTSPSMTMLVGPLEAGSSSLKDWFQQEEGVVVLRLIAEAVERYGSRGEEALAVANIGQVRLQPRHTLRAGLQYVADVSVDMRDLIQDAFDDGSDGSARPIPVVLRFSNIGMQRAPRRLRLRSLRTDRQSRQAGSVPAVIDDVGLAQE